MGMEAIATVITVVKSFMIQALWENLFCWAFKFFTVYSKEQFKILSTIKKIIVWSWGARKLTGDYLKVAFAELSTLILTVFVISVRKSYCPE